MIFLYYLSHEIYANTQNTILCDKIYYLNKIMNSVDLFYAIELPQKFGAEHPLGSVMGRAKYGEGFFKDVLLVEQMVKMEKSIILYWEKMYRCLLIQVYWEDAMWVIM